MSDPAAAPRAGRRASAMPGPADALLPAIPVSGGPPLGQSRPAARFPGAAPVRHPLEGLRHA